MTRLLLALGALLLATACTSSEGLVAKLSAGQEARAIVRGEEPHVTLAARGGRVEAVFEDGQGRTSEATTSTGGRVGLQLPGPVTLTISNVTNQAVTVRVTARGSSGISWSVGPAGGPHADVEAGEPQPVRR